MFGGFVRSGGAGALAAFERALVERDAKGRQAAQAQKGRLAEIDVEPFSDDAVERFVSGFVRDVGHDDRIVGGQSGGAEVAVIEEEIEQGGEREHGQDDGGDDAGGPRRTFRGTLVAERNARFPGVTLLTFRAVGGAAVGLSDGWRVREQDGVVVEGAIGRHGGEVAGGAGRLDGGFGISQRHGRGARAVFAAGNARDRTEELSAVV